MINGRFLDWGKSFEAAVQLVGGKGCNLGKLNRYGFKIPIGGVLTTEAYKDFVAENKLQEIIERATVEINIENVGQESTEQLLNHIRESIMTSEIPLHILKELEQKLSNMGILNSPLAVRSSASAEDSQQASFAGIHDSFLNVKEMNGIMSAIRECYASLWTLKAVTYRRKMNLEDNQVLPALVIMEMIDAKAAGIGFTCNPLTGQQDIIVINANFGFGESVVNGRVEPDEYILDGSQRYALPITIHTKTGNKEGCTIYREAGGTQFKKYLAPSREQVLSEEQLKKLGLLMLRVFESLGCGITHQDVEWVYDGTDFILVQARPVTVLPKCTFPEIKNQPEIWSNGNYKDSIPMVLSTISVPILINLIETVVISSYEAIDYPVPQGLKHCKLFQGRLYANLSALQWGYFDSMGIRPDQTNYYWGGHQPEIKIDSQHPYKGKRGVARIWGCCKMLLAQTSAKRKAENFFNKVRKNAIDWRNQGFQQVEDDKIINIFNELNNLLEECGYMLCLLVGSAGSPSVVATNLLEKFFPGRGNLMLNPLMSGIADITSAQHGYRLMEITEMAAKDVNAREFFTSQPFKPCRWEKELSESSLFKQAFDSFLIDYGHRGVYEFEIMNPRWREDPSYLLNTIRDNLDNCKLTEVRARQEATREKAAREVKEKVPFFWRLGINYWVNQTLKGAEWKEMARSVCILPFEIIRLMALEIGNRFKARGIIDEQADIFHCSWPEIFSILAGEWEGRELKTIINERKIRREELDLLAAPDLIIGEAPQFVTVDTYGSGNVLTGYGIGAGRATGTAKLVYHPNEGGKVQCGDVLVAPSTDPAWTPLFLKAAAIVMEIGGFLSHGAIVAREYGIPAVVNIPGVMKIIKDGQKIVVDGDKGKVFLLD